MLPAEKKPKAREASRRLSSCEYPCLAIYAPEREVPPVSQSGGALVYSQQKVFVEFRILKATFLSTLERKAAFRVTGVKLLEVASSH